MLFLPFESQPETKFAIIGGLHLLQKLGTSPDEEPIDYQASVRAQVRSLLVLENAAQRLSEKAGITLAAAKQQIFGATVPKEGEESEGSSFYQYFTAEEAAEFIEANAVASNRMDQAVKAATYLIRNRCAYPVKVREVAAAGSTELPIAPLSYPLTKGHSIKFGEDAIVQLREFHPVGSRLLKANNLPRPLEVETIGYLLDTESGDYRIGNPEWTEEATKRYLKTETVAEIYRFFLAEKAGVKDWQSFNLLDGNESEEANEESEKNGLESSDASLELSQSTGDESTGNFNTTAAPTKGSRRKTLESSPVG